MPKATVPVSLLKTDARHVLYSVRSERLQVDQISYNLLLRGCVGLAIEGPVWNHSVFSKNRDWLIAFDAVTEGFNVTVEMATSKGLLSDEHFSVDGSLIQGWASHKSVLGKDGSDDDRPPDCWHGEIRSNASHASVTNPDSKLYRQCSVTPAQLSYLSHVLTDKPLK